jgi:hypothetical protein
VFLLITSTILLFSSIILIKFYHITKVMFFFKSSCGLSTKKEETFGRVHCKEAVPKTKQIFPEKEWPQS